VGHRQKIKKTSFRRTYEKDETYFSGKYHGGVYAFWRGMPET
jgi:hypothetical protein